MQGAMDLGDLRARQPNGLLVAPARGEGIMNYHHLRYFWAVAREKSVSRAAKELRVAQPTVSEQIRLLEDSLGERLLERAGRGVELTEIGKVAFRFADEIFSLGAELSDTLKGRTQGRPTRLTVGVLDAIPKWVTARILAPLMAVSGSVGLRVVCYEDKAERLLDDLSAHTLDVVLADGPIGPSHDARAHNHLLGEAEVAVFGTVELVREAKRSFPRSLAGMPFLLPTPDAPLRRALEGWLDERGILPNVVGEIQDSALLTTFGEMGKGLFAAPDAVDEAILRARGLAKAGGLVPLRERFYAVTVARKLEHPAVASLVSAARAALFPKKPPRDAPKPKASRHEGAEPRPGVASAVASAPPKTRAGSAPKGRSERAPSKGRPSSGTRVS